MWVMSRLYTERISDGGQSVESVWLWSEFTGEEATATIYRIVVSRRPQRVKRFTCVTTAQLDKRQRALESDTPVGPQWLLNSQNVV